MDDDAIQALIEIEHAEIQVLLDSLRSGAPIMSVVDAISKFFERPIYLSRYKAFKRQIDFELKLRADSDRGRTIEDALNDCVKCNICLLILNDVPVKQLRSRLSDAVCVDLLGSDFRRLTRRRTDHVDTEDLLDIPASKEEGYALERLPIRLDRIQMTADQERFFWAWLDSGNVSQVARELGMSLSQGYKFANQLRGFLS